MRITSLGALSVCVCSLAVPVQAVVLECEVKGDSASWFEHFDTDKETGWKKDGYSHTKTERIDLSKPGDKGAAYKEVDISVSRYLARMDRSAIRESAPQLSIFPATCCGFYGPSGVFSGKGA